MKKKISLLLALLFCLALLSACGAQPDAPAETEAPAESETPAAPEESLPPHAAPDPDGGSRFVGHWTDTLSQRAWLTIFPTEFSGVYSVLLHWGDTAASFFEWDMTASFDGSGSLRYADGRQFYVTLHEDAPETRTQKGAESVGRFYLEDGALRWEDDKDSSAADLRFVKVPGLVPDAAELAERFLRPVAGVNSGSSGARLRQAQAACGALQLAADYSLWCAEPVELRLHLQQAWAGLSAEEQAAFSLHYSSVCELGLSASANWESFAAVFDDAGVAEQMCALSADREAIAGLRCLYELTAAVCAG